MASGISVDTESLSLRDAKRIFQGLVIPRPIAFITSVSNAGVVNAAPFSFFNMVAVAPPVCALGIEEQDGGGLKDTSANIQSAGTFVLNLVDEALGETMNQCATNFPPGTSEVEELGLATLPSIKVKAPRLRDAPASFECRLREKIQLGPDHYVFLADVVYVHIRDGIVNPENLHADLGVYKPLARLSGSLYSSIGQPFSHHRLNYDQWQARKAST
jgi:flavin reductase (DIM6/NTAB) family NADH-FMN oxidoreductase RutF